ncbi:MAG: Fic/DOC family N-terminal domain-containing protein [Candidatus Margulisiibacteriota bacterium]|jgi:Fic family protein
MDIQKFISGKWQKGYEYSYFLPELINHQWIISDPKVQKRLETVSLKLGELNYFAKFIPNINLFIQSYVMKEAVTSSRIEGTKTNIEEAFSDELDIDPEHRNDWIETSQYVKSLNFALENLNKIPLSNRLLKEVHEILLSQVRGKHKNPGEFRASQNWIGGATLNDAVFIPPSADWVNNLMSDIEKFIHNEEILIPDIIKIAIVHYQFETVHPFLDGNGRIGRLLIPLYLVSKKILDKPILYISDFFEKNKSLYYDKLTFVREKNDLLGWILFFLQAVETTATEAIQSLQNILALKDHITTKKIPILGKKTQNAQKFLEILFQKPIVFSQLVQEKVGLSTKASNELIIDFVNLKILEEITGYKRNRLFIFREYLEILNK